MTESFSVSVMARSFEENSSTQRRRLKGVREQWKKSDRRGQGRYSKPPGTMMLTNLTNSLFAPAKDINSDVSLPDLCAPTWLNLAIGLLLSIKAIRQSPPRSTNMKTPLLIDVANFIENWCLYLDLTQSKKQKNAVQRKLLNTDFAIPDDVPDDTSQQSIFLLRNVLLPIISESILAIKTHNCGNCKYTINKYIVVDHIPIGLVDGKLLFRNEILTYFNNASSDLLCQRCSHPMDRQIELLDCKYIFSFPSNGYKFVEYSRSTYYSCHCQ